MIEILKYNHYDLDIFENMLLEKKIKKNIVNNLKDNKKITVKVENKAHKM